MTSTNPQFGNADGAAYEVPELIKRLGDVSYGELLKQDRLDMVAAIATHSNNVNELILDGLQSIGNLMALVGCGEHDVGRDHVVQLGVLIKHLASEANFLRATHNDMHYILTEQEVLRAAAKPVSQRNAAIEQGAAS
jgi:hypothetical protein